MKNVVIYYFTIILSIKMDIVEEEPMTEEEKLQSAADHFGLGKISFLKRVGGHANANYIISTDKGEFFLKIVLESHGIEEKTKEQLYLTRLAEHHLAVYPYITAEDDSLVCEVEGRLVMAQEKIEGQEPESSEEVVSQLGEELAKMHKIPANDLPEKKHWLGSGYLTSALETALKNFPDHPDIKKLKKIYDSLKIDIGSLPQSIVHGDIFPDNTLFKRGQLAAIIDWEEVGVGCSLLDFAMAVVGMCFRNGRFHPELYKALLESYNAIRPMTDGEKSHITDAVRYAGLTLTIWRFLQHNYYYPGEGHEGRYKQFWDDGMDSWREPKST